MNSEKLGILAQIDRDGAYALKGAGPEVLGDRDIIHAAICKHPWALELASEDLRNDRQTVFLALKATGAVLYAASAELRNDRQIVSQAVRNYGQALQWASPGLRADRDIAQAAVMKADYAWKWVGKALKQDRAFLAELLDSVPSMLKSLDPHWKNDRELVLIAVRRDGNTIRYASDALKADAQLQEEARASNRRLDGERSR